MAHAAHPSTWEAEEDHRKFEARLGYTVRFLKLRKVNKSTIGKQLLSFFFPPFFVCLLAFFCFRFIFRVWRSGSVVKSRDLSEDQGSVPRTPRVCLHESVHASAETFGGQRLWIPWSRSHGAVSH